MIKELKRTKTTYDNLWIKYQDENGKIGYEFIFREDEVINPRADKILIENIDIKDEIIYLRDNPIEMIYLDKKSFEENGKLDEYLIQEEKASKTLEKYPYLDTQIKVCKDPGDEHLIFHEGIITEVLF